MPVFVAHVVAEALQSEEQVRPREVSHGHVGMGVVLKGPTTVTWSFVCATGSHRLDLWLQCSVFLRSLHTFHWDKAFRLIPQLG